MKVEDISLMEQSSTIDIFLPDYLRKNCFHHILIGFFQILHNYVQVNCVLAMNIEDRKANFKSTLTLLQNEKKKFESWNFGIMGIISNEIELSYLMKTYSKSTDEAKSFFFTIDIEYLDRLYIKELWLRGKRIDDTRGCRIIIYNACNLLSSHLILHEGKYGERDTFSSRNDYFINFVRSTAEHITETRDTFSSIYIGVQDDFPYYQEEGKRSSCTILPTQILMYIVLIYESIYNMCCSRLPIFLKNVTLLSSVGQQLHRRLFHINAILKRLKHEKILPLSRRNSICSILFDLLCGWILTYVIWHYYPLSIPLQYALDYATAVVNELEQLIHWLMGVPAGLKLNLPLNTALGHFFLYHIYLWKTYMTIVRPIFSLVLESSALLGMLGVTFVMCLFNDLLSIVTIHIYCFYGYAARIYGYQIGGLCALWRLFRGRKWNPLRIRVDSFTYDYNQLYVGTLFFTLFMFLLPTVMAYYFVFTCLRIVVVSVQGIITRCIRTLGNFPLYIIILRISDSALTTGDVYFKVLQEEGVLTLSMKLVQIPMMSVITSTLPEDTHYEEPLSWNEFLHCVLWGKIIYPM